MELIHDGTKFDTNAVTIIKASAMRLVAVLSSTVDHIVIVMIHRMVLAIDVREAEMIGEPLSTKGEAALIPNDKNMTIVTAIMVIESLPLGKYMVRSLPTHQSLLLAPCHSTSPLNVNLLASLAR
jgi:hypothetical protein